ncbi:hypothetical protein BCR33DRAFT_736722 [Rhizoclosmatium globosum]|uniref:Uncharacterized protein n=1 Tax=Rhizoclosmatium globosum TaxID=329046 RepID=A0A1Y2CHT2_9FUNG|nr:hypothetical protein BCR33DRAFT_736722 [Rhizoclosmatium globosum]|eukprot:ORY46562.1 hypothetical protein BCR33DRAFT_736722 [Rhizoclosmatium globosum]
MLSSKPATTTTTTTTSTPSKQIASDLSRLDFASATKSRALFFGANDDSDDDDAAFDAPLVPKLIQEPLLVENKHRFVLFPIQYQKIWAAYKNAEAKFWSAEEIEFGDDSDGDEPIISKLSDEIQKYITDSPYSYSTRLFAVAVYLTLWNSAAQTLLLALSPKAACETAPFQGLAKAIVKVQGDLHRHAQFYRLLASEHCVNAVHVSEAVSMVREAVLIEGSVCEEMMEMGGAGGGKKGVYVAKDVFVGYEQVVGRVERLGRDVLKAFGVRSTLFEGTNKKDSLEWMDQVLWGLVQKDSGVVEHVVSVRDNVKTEERKEKMNVRQEFSLDEDF